jgi:hypothetical protein
VASQLVEYRFFQKSKNSNGLQEIIKVIVESWRWVCIDIGMKFVDVGLYKWWFFQLCIVIEILEANPIIQSKSRA